MKVLILAGGFETKLSGETDLKPKPMVEMWLTNPAPWTKWIGE